MASGPDALTRPFTDRTAWAARVRISSHLYNRAEDGSRAATVLSDFVDRPSAG